MCSITTTRTSAMNFKKLFYTLIVFFVFANLAKADPAEETTTASTTTLAPTTTLKETSVWATGTDSNGNTVTTESVYTQKFSSMYRSVATPSSGTIGLGTIQGNVGHVRTDRVITITRQMNRGASYAPKTSEPTPTCAL